MQVHFRSEGSIFLLPFVLLAIFSTLTGDDLWLLSQWYLNSHYFWRPLKNILLPNLSSQTQILFLEILNVFLWLIPPWAGSSSSSQDKIEHFSQVSFPGPDRLVASWVCLVQAYGPGRA